MSDANPTAAELLAAVKDIADGIDVTATLDSTGLATATGQTTLAADIGPPDATAANADTGTFNLNALIKRLIAKFTTQLPAALAANGGMKVELASALSSATDSVAIGPADSTFMDIDVDETEDDIKVTAGTIYGWVITNVSAGIRYVRFYNATAANTTVGTTAAQLVIALPIGAGVSWHSTRGISFSTAICIAATTGVAANDTGAPGASDIIAFVDYA